MYYVVITDQWCHIVISLLEGLRPIGQHICAYDNIDTYPISKFIQHLMGRYLL